MSFPRRICCLALLACCCAASALRAEAKAPAAILPAEFDGWQLHGSLQSGTDPAKLDPTAARVLAEDRFIRYEKATYRQPGRTLTVEAARFNDAEGAYAAFTFYRQPRMRREEIGTLAASDNERVLFFFGDILVDARFDHLTAMSGAQLRDLAARLPQTTGPAAALPTLPGYLPRRGLVPQTARYLMGPEALAALNIDLSPAVVDFSKSPRLLWARVNGEANASAEILLVSYPTPQIAMARLGAFEELAPPAGEEGRGDRAAENILVKRSGPLVALVRGNISRSAAQRLLDGVNYDAEVTWDQRTGLSRRENVGSFVLAAMTLAGILFLISVGAGAVFGLGRWLIPWYRVRHGGQPADDAGIIRLRLR
jgi:hypothetical protein